MNRNREVSPIGGAADSARESTRRQLTTRTRSARRVVALAAVVLPVAACFRSVTEGGTVTKYGAISVVGSPAAGGTATASATAIFFQAYAVSVPDSRLQSNTCQFSTVDTTRGISPGVLRAGNSLTMTVGSGGVTTQRDMAFESLTARYLSASAAPYKANDSVTIAIPGDVTGFPASSIKVRLAEPLLPQDVTMPTSSSGDLAIRWNASSDSTTAIIVSLKYANPATSTYANEQILCALKDDGAEDILAAALGPFTLSPVAMRSLRLTRWRTTTVTPSDASLLHIVTTVDTIVKLK